MRYLVDSSVYISLYVEDDVFHNQTVSAALIIEAELVVVPTLVIAEVITVLSRNQPSKVATALRHLFREEVIALDSDFLSKFSKYASRSLHLKTSDLVIAVTASVHKATLVTWDKQLLTFAGSICTVVSPSTLLKMSGLK